MPLVCWQGCWGGKGQRDPVAAEGEEGEGRASPRESTDSIPLFFFLSLFPPSPLSP